MSNIDVLSFLPCVDAYPEDLVDFGNEWRLKSVVNAERSMELNGAISSPWTWIHNAITDIGKKTDYR